MKDLIVDIIKRFGGRRAGSLQERRAQDYIAKRLSKISHSVQQQNFREYLTAHFGGMRIICTIYYIGLVLTLFWPMVALIVLTANAILFQFHFVSYHSWLNFLFKPSESVNTVATIEPRKSARSTLYFVAHMDSTPEFIWWYYLKNFGGFLTLLASILFLFTPVLLVYALFQPAMLEWQYPNLPTWWIVLAALTPSTLAFFKMHGQRVVPGASDNLSGISCIFHAAQALTEKKGGELVSKLEHTRICVLSAGSEECGLKGSRAYVREHWAPLTTSDTAVVNVDGILSRKHLHIIIGELNTNIFYPKAMIKKMEAAFQANSVPVKKGVIPMGATDGTSFHRAGIPTVTLVAQPLTRLVPQYHTRLDQAKYIDETLLETVRDILVTFANQWDTEKTP